MFSVADFSHSVRLLPGILIGIGGGMCVVYVLARIVEWFEDIDGMKKRLNEIEKEKRVDR